MKSFVKTGVFVFLVMVMLISLVSCSGISIRSNKNSDEEEIVIVEAHGELTWSCNNVPEEERVKYIAFANAFMKRYPNVKINLDFKEIGIRFETGEIGDIVSLNSLNKYSRFLMPLDAYIEALKIDTENINQIAYKMALRVDRMFGVPQEIIPLVLYTNIDLLKEEGLPFPQNDWTWEEFKYKYAPKLVKLNEDGTYKQIPMYLPVDYTPALITFLEGWDGNWFDDINYQMKLMDDKVLAGFDELIDNIEKGYIDPGIPDISSKYDNLSKNDYAFGILTPYTYLEDISWEIVPFPLTQDSAIGLDVNYCVVNNRSIRPDTSALFPLFFLTESGQKAYHSVGRFSIPILNSAENKDYWVREYKNKNYDAFLYHSSLNTLGDFECKLSYATSNQLKTRLYTIFSNYLNGEKFYKDSLYQTETEINKLIQNEKQSNVLF